MNLKSMSTREQVLVAIVIFTLVGGGYGLFRYRPALKSLGELQAANVATAARTRDAVIPEEPMDDPAEIKASIAEAAQELEKMRQGFVEVEQRLAPVDSQELRLKISDVATTAGVRIRENVPYLVPRVAATATDSAAAAPKLSKRQQRAANKAARKSGNPGGLGAAVTAAAPKEGELAFQLVNEIDPPRPFQRVSVEGSFAQLQRFIQELAKLPWMVTITQINIELSPQTPPPGYPQPLVVTMILAL